MDKLPAKKGDRHPRPIGRSDWSRIGTSIRRCNPPVPPYPCFSPWHCRGLSFPRRGATFRVASLRSSLRIRPSLARIDRVHKRRASPAYQPPRMRASHATPLSPVREYASDRDARSGRSLGINRVQRKPIRAEAKASLPGSLKVGMGLPGVNTGWAALRISRQYAPKGGDI
jgi:hypothetical protein